MPIVYIETHTLAAGKYQLVQSAFIGLSPLSETVTEYESEDRLTAAIVNLGFACRWLHDNYKEWKSNIINIVSDKDGKDKRYNGEQDIMYYLLFPHTHSEARKQARLYAEYDRHLSRLWFLIRGAGIKIQLVDREEKTNEIS